MLFSTKSKNQVLCQYNSIADHECWHYTKKHILSNHFSQKKSSRGRADKIAQKQYISMAYIVNKIKTMTPFTNISNDSTYCISRTSSWSGRCRPFVSINTLLLWHPVPRRAVNQSIRSITFAPQTQVRCPSFTTGFADSLYLTSARVQEDGIK